MENLNFVCVRWKEGDQPGIHRRAHKLTMNTVSLWWRKRVGMRDSRVRCASDQADTHFQEKRRYSQPSAGGRYTYLAGLKRVSIQFLERR